MSIRLLIHPRDQSFDRTLHNQPVLIIEHRLGPVGRSWWAGRSGGHLPNAVWRERFGDRSTSQASDQLPHSSAHADLQNLWIYNVVLVTRDRAKEGVLIRRRWSHLLLVVVYLVDEVEVFSAYLYGPHDVPAPE
ncbi:uncharacterized protein MELLADRAFT_110624 [Melampsora larici-populina 98AG31]|uniref:Uncharacterized protein n=1 Tax=Melampsora larici-populina (strain 98AG31 / pathotype 3-4-7) TaxID=747676 RepID=F4S0F0_MELLP|nr:uncharacterized protein MELLADRAFT_110624 [Melampsora larici-populina 98AG31]EGG01878.1 hypothetical protein MELLADRAFT_110624 [Melampsora larici-populina 98AG31]